MNITKGMLKRLALDSEYRIVCDDTPFTIQHIRIPDPLDNRKKITVNYAVTGSGPALLLIHGWSSAWYSWFTTARYLRKNYTLYIIDLPGFGQSDRLNHYSVDILSNAVYSCIQELDIKPLSIAGLSMGTYVVAELMAKHPEVTEQIFLIGAVLKTDMLNRVSHIITQKSFRAIDNKEHAEPAAKKIFNTRIVAYFLAWLLGFYEFSTDLVDQYSQLARKKMTEGAFVDMYIGAMEYPLVETLKGVNTKVYMIYGDHDKLTTEDAARKKLAEEELNIDLYRVKNCGHCVNTERPKDLATLMHKLLSKNIPSA